MHARSRPARTSRLASTLAVGSAAAALAVLLSACTAASGEPVSADAAGATPEPAETTAAEPIAEPVADGTCIVGEWVIGEAELQGFYAAVNESIGAGMSFESHGTSGLTFREDGTYSYTPDLELDMLLGGLAGEITMTGSIDGNYVLADGVLQPSDQVTSNLSVTGTMAGQPIDGAAVAQQIAVAPLTEAPVDCSGPDPVIVFSTGSGTAEVVLTR